MALTTRGLAAIKPGEWQSDDGRRGAGRLLAYGMKAGGAAFYFRHALPDGKRDTLPLGHYDPRGRDGLTLAQASERAGELSRRHQAGERDLRTILEAEQREADRARREAEGATAADEAKRKATLGALMLAYVEQLKRDGKASERQVDKAIRRHVKDAWPVLWEKSAEDVTQDDLLSVVARVADAGKLREAAKLRSYLRAAYAAAVRARQDARGLAALRDLRITSNPARDLVTIEGATNSRDRALSIAELRAYWTRIAALPGAEGAMLRFHLLTGGQRVEQLARLTKGDIDRDAKAMTLFDAKGRRRKPRIHVVPLIHAAIEAVDSMAGDLGEFAFSISSGFSGAPYFVVQHRLRGVVDAMAKANELERGTFTVGDIRRTVETRLAGEGVSAEIRAQLQSHGLGGVQARHYDRHEYMAEKRDALETLYRLATGAAVKAKPKTSRRLNDGAKSG